MLYHLAAKNLFNHASHRTDTIFPLLVGEYLPNYSLPQSWSMELWTNPTSEVVATRALL